MIWRLESASAYKNKISRPKSFFDRFFENCNYWLKEDGILCLHLVNRKKFDPILEKSSPWPMFSLQRYSNERLSKSTLVFDKFKYDANFNLNDNIGTFKEKQRT